MQGASIEKKFLEKLKREIITTDLTADVSDKLTSNRTEIVSLIKGRKRFNRFAQGFSLMASILIFLSAIVSILASVSFFERCMKELTLLAGIMSLLSTSLIRAADSAKRVSSRKSSQLSYKLREICYSQA